MSRANDPQGSSSNTSTASLHDSSPKKEEEEIERASIASSKPSLLAPQDPVRPEPPIRGTSHSSSRRLAAIPVPRSQRRGLLASLTLVPEVTVPSDYTNTTKWSLTALVALAAAAAPAGSAIIMPALLDISIALNSTPTVTNLSLAFYMLSMSIFPLWWSSFSETLGRRTIYIASFILFLLWNILSAVSTNIAMLIVMRVLSGGAAASVQAVGAGTIADMWEPRERGKAMGIFYLGPLCGPLLAPIIGGGLAGALGWRSTQWFLVIYGGVTLLGLVFLLPETLVIRKPIAPPSLPRDEKEAIGISEKDGKSTTTRPDMLTRVSTRQSVQLKTKRLAAILRRCFIDPLSIILYLRFPAVLVTVYYASITFGSLYVLNISIQQTFQEAPYSFSTTIVGLLYIPNSVGYLIASVFGGRWIDYIMKREAKKAGRYDEKGKLIFRPEDRMRENAWLGAFLFPGALLWYGWTSEYGIFWLVPMIANFFFGIGSMLIFALATTMLTEFLPRKASTGIAVNNFVRNIFSFVGAVAAEPVLNAIGAGWLFTILALVSVTTGPICIWSMKKYGSKWRDDLDKVVNAEP